MRAMDQNGSRKNLAQNCVERIGGKCYSMSIITILRVEWSPLYGGILSVLVFTGLTVGTGVISSQHNIVASPVLGASAYVDWLKYYYMVPYCRAGPYIIGIITGYLLRKNQCKAKIEWYWNALGWTVATACCMSTLYGLYGAAQGSPMDSVTAAIYNALHRSVWAFGVAWLIFSCATGHGGIINSFLSWGAFIPLSRLTYCAYLVHPTVLSFYGATKRNNFFYTDYDYVYHFLGTLVISLLCAFVLSIAFEAPMLGLEKALVTPHIKHKKRN
ncbi:hypothetical protein ScPMuIL_010796 [Solemya velum]